MSKQKPSQGSLSDWRQEYLEHKGSLLSPCQQKILIEGPHSLSQAWQLQAMKHEYKKIFKL
jgi:hypothetical protein